MAEDRWKSQVQALNKLLMPQLKKKLESLKTSDDIASKAQEVWREIAYDINISNIIYHIPADAKKIASCLRNTLTQQGLNEGKGYAYLILGKLEYCEQSNIDCIEHFLLAKNIYKNCSNLHLAFACLKFGDERAVTCLQNINFE